LATMRGLNVHLGVVAITEGVAGHRFCTAAVGTTSTQRACRLSHRAA
jgi:hypothetical protein